jgi:Leucine-rich repeat (LRR) protein
MNELKKLIGITKLKTLTIHGNPLDQLPNFRIYIIGILPNLKRLDTVLVTYKERDNAQVWRYTFGK